MIPPINIQKWIDENRDKLKPPVGNQIVYKDTEFIIMVVGGPNARKDFHYNEGEEFFYQIEGDIQLPTIQDGKVVTYDIKEGEIFLLPARVPHSPQRPANTVGLVIERIRTEEELDYCYWYCENCNNELHTPWPPPLSVRLPGSCATYLFASGSHPSKVRERSLPLC
ncbi:MAG: 3-hydroxyanthranilate 3,4-dioxygenase [Kordia sp.]|nr:MAG: 3-hydroxyanthranilate 3,4-dioxygenase [Kordia sp.]